MTVTIEGLLGATFAAVFGAVIALFFERKSRNHLGTLVEIATGALFAVTIFDILPEAKQSLSWINLLLSVGLGFGLLWIIGKKVFPVCPSCSVSHFAAGLQEMDTKSIILLSIALGIHCSLDGIALAAGSGLSLAGNGGIMTGIILHKIPEGFALALLLFGAGMKSLNAFLLTVAVESLTIVGGIAGILFFSSQGALWTPAVFAFIGGGFLYLVFNNWSSSLKHVDNSSRLKWIWIEGASFCTVGAFLGLLTKLGS